MLGFKFIYLFRFIKDRRLKIAENVKDNARMILTFCIFIGFVMVMSFFMFLTRGNSALYVSVFCACFRNGAG
jgi:hypothetical protein